tara:strand:+ start:66 stop:584 length:519 start_codon:yes stop_codon:yes gene_type:complete
MSSISKLISKSAPTKLREMTPIQRVLARSLLGNKFKKLYVEARRDADRDCDFDRDCDVTPEACTLYSSDVPKSKRAEFAKSFGDSLVVDEKSITMSTDWTYDSNNNRTYGVTIQESNGVLLIAKTFVPVSADGAGDTAVDDDEMVAVPYGCGKGVTMHAWVSKRVAGDMMGH